MLAGSSTIASRPSTRGFRSGSTTRSKLLLAVREQMDELKASHEIDASTAIVGFGDVAPPVLAAVLARALVHSQEIVETVATNVPGPQVPLYVCGRRMLEAYPYVPIAGHIRIGVAIWSYCGDMYIGITGDWESARDVDRLAREIDIALQVLSREAASRPVDAMTSAFRTSSFLFSGNRLVYDDYGEGERLVVYMHGLLSTRRSIVASRGRSRPVATGSCCSTCSGTAAATSRRTRRQYRIDTYADQVFALLDELGAEQAVLGGMSLGANVSLFAATPPPGPGPRTRARDAGARVGRARRPHCSSRHSCCSCTMAAGPFDGVSTLCTVLPPTRSEPLNSLIHAVGLPPEVIAAILHGVLVGPVAPTQEERARDRRADARARAPQRSHPPVRRRGQARDGSSRRARLVRARSPIELRLRSDRLTDVIASFVKDVWTGRPRDDEDDAPNIGALP